MIVPAGWLLPALIMVVAPAWTQFRMGPQNNAVLDGTLQATWRLETGGQISASPTIVDDTLFVGNNNGSLYAIDVGTGKVVWKAHVTNPLMSAPLVYGDVDHRRRRRPDEPHLVAFRTGQRRPGTERR